MTADNTNWIVKSIDQTLKDIDTIKNHKQNAQIILHMMCDLGMLCMVYKL